jgi:hypothetical protein
MWVTFHLGPSKLQSFVVLLCNSNSMLIHVISMDRAWKVGMDKLFRPFYNNFMIKSEQKEKFKEIARFITCGNDGSGWEVETIIPAHGDIIRGKDLCRKVLERHFNIQCADDCTGSQSNGLESHYLSSTTLDWLSKMALSYKLEKGEELLDVLKREGSSIDTRTNSHQADDPLLQLAEICAQSSLPVASHDFIRDPQGVAIYNYGNREFLNAFGYDWDEFVELPSKYCVESEAEREERQKLLDAVKDSMTKANSGSISESKELASKYNNVIRVRKDKRRISLTGVNLWNVYDLSAGDDLESARRGIENGELKAIGQAVWIKQWDHL